MTFSYVARISAAALVGATIALPAAAFGIGLQPTTVEIAVEPGERQRQIVNLGNVHEEQTISLTVGLADWTLDERGQIELAPPGERPESASNWVRFSPAFITLGPGESEQIVVDMAAPIRTDSEGDHRFALIASTVLPESRAGQSGVWKKYQIASLFYLTMGDAHSQPTIESAGLTVGPDGRQSVAVDLTNDGNAHARLRGQVSITGDKGADVTMPISNLVVLHDADRTFTMPVTGDLPANPEIKVTLENIFSPQSAGGTTLVTPYAAPLVVKQGALTPAVAAIRLE